ncbi:tetratricopeptide repeat protein [Magnetococcus sp. PR-3]|uniref:tetratricopeptide repeat protein n=1 Tax=Magnetococcus sp. PR-3 TaxID=3120355 RepID=UPI002FCE0ADA
MSVIYKAMRNLQRKKAEDEVSPSAADAAPEVVAESESEEKVSLLKRLNKRQWIMLGAGLVILSGLGGWIGLTYMEGVKEDQIALQKRQQAQQQRARRAAEDATTESLGDLKLEDVISLFSKDGGVPVMDQIALLQAAKAQLIVASEKAQVPGKKAEAKDKLPDALEAFLSFDQILEDAKKKKAENLAAIASGKPGQMPAMTESNTAPLSLDQLEFVRQLTLDLNHAIQKNRSKQVKKLLAKLRQSRGTEHPIVLKMEAYWHLKNRQYSKAAKRLYKVLYTQPLDRDARLNLVITQMHLGQWREAKRGLRDLREDFPDDVQIAQLMKRYTE